MNRGRAGATARLRSTCLRASEMEMMIAMIPRIADTRPKTRASVFSVDTEDELVNGTWKVYCKVQALDLRMFWY